MTKEQANFLNPFRHFNSHTREGVTVLLAELMVTCGNFNSHTREGVTQYDLAIHQSYLYFNSHTREGVTLDVFI